MGSRSRRVRAITSDVAEDEASSSGATDTSINRLAEAMRLAFNDFATSTRPQMVKGDVIPEFDPSDVDQSIEDWCQKVDQVRAMFHWTEEITIFNALSKLRGNAARWYKGLRNLNFTWEEWKDKLALSFPSQRDYHDLLEAMMSRRKRSNETMAEYFYAKQALLNACEIDGRKAVACIIGGIPEQGIRLAAKAIRCPTPETLLKYLTDLKNETQHASSFRKVERYDRKRRYNEGKTVATSVCYSCRKPGHVMNNCPEKKKETSVDKQKHFTVGKTRRCFLCQATDHIAVTCPKRRKAIEETK